VQKDKLEYYVKALKGGDKSAFDAVYDNTHKAVYFAIYYILKDKMKAEDILQETYIIAFRKLDMYNDNTNFFSWLITIARRLAINYYNRHQKEQPFDFGENESMFGKYYMEDKADSGLIKLARETLEEDEFQIVMLAEVAGYKRRELSEMLNIPISTISYKHKQALEKLKQRLIKEDKGL